MMAQPNLSLHPNSAFLVFRFLGRSSCARQLLTHFAISFCFLVSSLAVRRLLIFSVSSFWLNSTFSYPPLYNIGHPRTHAISHAPARESDTFDQVLLPRYRVDLFRDSVRSPHAFSSRPSSTEYNILSNPLSSSFLNLSKPYFTAILQATKLTSWFRQ